MLSRCRSLKALSICRLHMPLLHSLHQRGSGVSLQMSLRWCLPLQASRPVNGIYIQLIHIFIKFSHIMCMYVYFSPVKKLPRAPGELHYHILFRTEPYARPSCRLCRPYRPCRWRIWHCRCHLCSPHRSRRCSQPVYHRCTGRRCRLSCPGC